MSNSRTPWILSGMLLLLVIGLTVVLLSPRRGQSGPQVTSAPKAARYLLPPTGFSNPQAAEQAQARAAAAAAAAAPAPAPEAPSLVFSASVRAPYGTGIWWTTPQGKVYLFRVLLPEVPDGPPTLCFANKDGSNAVNLQLNRRQEGNWDTAPYVDGVMLGIIKLTLEPDIFTLEASEGFLEIDP